MLFLLPTFLAIVSSILPIAAAHGTPTSPSHNLPTKYCTYRPASTLQQASQFDGYVTAFYIDKDFVRSIEDYIDGPQFIEHSPSIRHKSSEEILPDLYREWAKVNITILHISFDSGIGYVHYWVAGLGPTPIAFVDIFRMNGTCIAEHWDVIQPRAANATEGDLF